MTRKITEEVSENINAKITFEDVKIGFINKISFRKFYVEDQQGDTLIFSRLLSVNLNKFNRKKREISFGKIEIIDARVKFKTDSANIINLKFITDRLKRKDTTKARWKISINSIKLRNTFFSYNKYNYKTTPGKFNLKDLQLSDLNLDVSNLQTHHDSIDFFIENMKCRDHSGMVIGNLDFSMHISPHYLNFHELKFSSPQSELIADRVDFSFNSYKSLKDFLNNVELNIDIQRSTLASSDLGYIIPSLIRIPGKIDLSGNITGSINNLKGKKIETGWGRNTYASYNFALNGLPDINKTFIFIDIDSLQTNVRDIKKISANGNKGSLSLPSQLEKLGMITYSGNFTGFIDDFVAYGLFNSDLGKISTDLTIEPDTSSIIRYNGKMRTENFNLGKLFNKTDQVGDLTMNIHINGFSIKNSYKATLNGNIADLLLNNYHYQNIDLSGEFTPKSYDGSVYINDPNIELKFLGSLDFSSEIPEFDFTANVPKANLYNLNIEQKDSSSFLSFLLTANFKGKNIDDLEGKINLINSTYRKENEELSVYDFSLSALSQNDTNQLKLKTDFVDASITGNYNFNQLGYSFKYFLNRALPSIHLSKDTTINKENNHFNFTILLKDTRNINKFLFPSFIISPNSTINGKFYPDNNYFLVNGKSENFTYRGNVFNKMLLNAEFSDSLFSFNLESNELVMNNNINLDNFAIKSNANNDTINLGINWFDPENHALNSKINAIAGFKYKLNQQTPLINISFLPTDLYIKDSIWKINPGTITIDTTSVMVKKFSINNNKQWLKVDGGISEQYKDTLIMQFRDLNLSSLNALLRGKNINLNGLLNGNASLSNLYNNPIFQTNLNIDSFLINNEPFGKTYISSVWDTLNEKLHMQIISDRGELKTLSIKGDYEPESKEIDFALSLNKLRLNIFQPFTNKISSELNGIATGDIILNGTLNQPEANGFIKMQKISFLLDFFNTRYTFTDKIKIEDNVIKFENIRIFDIEGNQALIDGAIRNDYYKNFDIDLKIDATNLLVMNTREENNDKFYGTAYGTGIVTINGKPKNLSIKASLKTEENTRFFLPLSSGKEFDEFNFVSFVNETNHSDNQQKEIIRVESNMPKINLDLEITPYAEAQIIFNPKIGDNIKGRGSGNLNLKINNPGEMDIFGTYTIEQGEYLFSLQNIINKKFKVKNGGTINWNGSPLDANMDIEAFYETKASLYELFLNDAYRQRIPVECQLKLTGKIQNPKIGFNIELPTADQETRTNLQNIINTQEEMSKQFLSLIVINSFLPNTNYIPTTSQPIVNNYTPAVGVTTSELLSNQLSNWLSQISNDFDIGFRYRPGDEISSNEVEVAMSTQLLNDRVSINGNVDVGGNETSSNTSNIVGDFTVDVKINKSGKLRVKAFTRANDKLLYEWSPYTQGVGLFYREEFDHFDQLLQSYWNKIFKRKPEDEEGN